MLVRRTETPASIQYTVTTAPLNNFRKTVSDTGSSIVQYINFNAVVSEDHETKATITKYPVQEGIHVSNHSIRHNRQVVLEGVITDVQIEGPRNTDYGTTPSKSVKAALDDLVNSGYECTVTTNLGIYTPVVFSRLKTKQKAGLMDSMHFTIIGEEIIKVDTNNYTAPTPVIFSVVNDADRPALVGELASSGIFVSSDEVLSQGTFVKGEDFRLDGVDEAGNPVETVYEFQGVDPSTGKSSYGIHYDLAAVGAKVSDTATSVVGNVVPEQLQGGVLQVGDCLFSEAGSVVEQFAEDTVDTAMGKLQRSAYGVFYDTTTMGDEYGTMMAKVSTRVWRTIRRQSNINKNRLLRNTYEH